MTDTTSEHVDVLAARPSAVSAAAAELDGRATVTVLRVGAAAGLLMTRRDVSFDYAFELLRRSGACHGMGIRDIAEHVLATGELPPP